MKKTMMAFILAAMAAVPARAQLTGCQYTGGPWQLQKIRSTAAGSQIMGCINATFEALSSSVPINSTSAYNTLGWIGVNRVSGLSSGASGIWISSVTTLTSSMTITGGYGIGVTYGADLGSATVRDRLVVVGTATVQGNAFSIGGSSFTVAGGSSTVAYLMTARAFSGDGSALTSVPNTSPCAPGAGTNSMLCQGVSNTAAGIRATASGGASNAAGGDNSVVAGGASNSTGAGYAVVSGGFNNVANGNYGTILGGSDGIASASYSTVIGGILNSASDTYTLAAGRRAKAAHSGAFVWADSTNADYTSAAIDSFNVRATNGAFFSAKVDVTKSSVNASGFFGPLVGAVTGDVTGNVVGNVTGSASNNVLKGGDTMTGALVVPNISLSGFISGAGGARLDGAAGIRTSSFTATYGINAATGAFSGAVSALGGVTAGAGTTTGFFFSGRPGSIDSPKDTLIRINTGTAQRSLSMTPTAVSVGEPTSGSPLASHTLKTTSGDGTNNTGSTLIIAAGQGSGTGLGGAITFQSSTGTVAGAVTQDYMEHARITPLGNLGIGTTSPATKLHMSSGTLTIDGNNAASIVANGTAVIASSTQVNGTLSVGEGTTADTVSSGNRMRIYDTTKPGIMVDGFSSLGASILGGEIRLGSSGSYHGKLSFDGANAHMNIVNIYDATDSRVQFVSRHTRVLASTATFTNGVLSVTAPASVPAGITPPIRTKAQNDAITPAVGQMIICSDCSAPYSICVATGATLSGYRRSDSTTIGCGTGN